MNRNVFNASAVALGLCAMLVVASAQAQRGEIDQAREPRDPQQDRSQAGQLDDATTGANIRVSQLIGMAIENSQGESVGEVSDLVIHADTSDVCYAAVTYGGFLGVGNKMFAVPFEAFEVRQDADDAGSYILVLDVTQSQLEGAEGFDESNWPDFGNSEFTDAIDSRYGVVRDQETQTTPRRTTVNP